MLITRKTAILSAFRIEDEENIPEWFSEALQAGYIAKTTFGYLDRRTGTVYLNGDYFIRDGDKVQGIERGLFPLLFSEIPEEEYTLEHYCAVLEIEQKVGIYAYANDQSPTLLPLEPNEMITLQLALAEFKIQCVQTFLATHKDFDKFMKPNKSVTLSGRFIRMINNQMLKYYGKITSEYLKGEYNENKTDNQRKELSKDGD